jgi:hypothetical protein
MAQLALETPYFAERSQDGLLNYWPASHNSGEDAVNEGKRRADALVAASRVSQTPIMFPHVARAIANGEFGLMEQAFFHRLGEHVLP